MNTQQTVITKSGTQKIGVKVTTELPKVKDANVNMRDRLNDVLLTEKHNLVSLQIAINEMINDDLRELVINNRNNIQNAHTRLFNEMFNLGEYQADIATGPQIRDSWDVFNNYRSQFPFKQ